MTKAELTDVIADAQARKDTSIDQHRQLAQQAMELNQRGVQLEKDLLGIDGELKALSALFEKATD